MLESFKKLNLKESLNKSLDILGFTNMTPIQSRSISYILEGRDVLAQAKTGSGKTAAFGLGILNKLETAKMIISSLILCPTRELSEQVAEEIRKLARFEKNVKILTLSGGVSEYFQVKSLEHGAHIIVGTPGRVLRLLKKRHLKLDNLTSFVLDEADKMLEMGFIEDINHIKAFAPKNIQNMFFSATYPDEIISLSSEVLNDAIEIKTDTDHIQNEIKQYFYEVGSHKDKPGSVLNALSFFKPTRCIVFCKTKAITDSLVKFLDREGVFAESIHGDLDQNERTKTLIMFSNKSLNVLVATDVAARGIDIKELDLVINFDLPSDPENYTHRIGRTGRAGMHGVAVNFFVEKEDYKVDRIKEYSQAKLTIEKIDMIRTDKKYELKPEMDTLFISGGKKNKLRAGDILGAFINEAGLVSEDIGEIKILNIISYVAVKRSKIDSVVNVFKTGKIKNRKFKVGLA